MIRHIVVGLLLVAALLAGLSQLVTPDPLPANAPADQASAGRAMAWVEAMAQRPHPTGSAANRRVREYLVGELETLGLEVVLQTRPVIHDHPRREEHQVRAAWPVNILARLRGSGEITGPGQAIALMSHYDSVPSSPGAGDDAAGVAVALETVRALQATQPLRRDLILVITDGEEIGLMGAQAFFREHAWAEEIGLALSFEARGADGPAAMFETSERAGALVNEFAHAAPHPTATSLSMEIYRRMPNDTDASIALAGDLQLLNFAFSDDFYRYHAGSDTPENLSAGTLQHAADNALALVTHFGRADAWPPSSSAITYFTPWYGRLLYYPGWASWLLSLLTVAAALAAIVAGWRRQRFSGLELLAGALTLLATLLAALWLLNGLYAAMAAVAQEFALFYRYHLLLIPYLLLSLALIGVLWGGSSRSRRNAAAVVLVAGVGFDLLAGAPGTLTWVAPVLLLVAALATPQLQAEAFAAAALLVWVLLTIAVTLLATHAAYAFAWPLGAAAAVYAWRWRRRHRHPAVAGLALVVTLLIWPVLIYGVYNALAVFSPGIMALLVVLVMALGAGYPASLLRARPAAGLAAAGLLVAGYATFVPPWSARHPQPVELIYAIDQASEQAWWLSSSDIHPWMATRLGDDPERIDPLDWPAGGRRELRGSSAPLLDLPMPRLALRESRVDADGFVLRLAVAAPRNMERLTLLFPAADYAAGTLNGLDVPLPAPGSEWRHDLWALPAGGAEIHLQGRGDPPSQVLVHGIRYRWPGAVDVLVGPPPPGVMSRPWGSNRALWTRQVWPLTDSGGIPAKAD